MNTALVILQIKQKIEQQGEVSLNSMGLLVGHIAEVVEALKNQDDYIVIYNGDETIIKKSLVKGEKENLELQELRTSVMLLTQQLSDYDKAKKNAVIANRTAIVVAIAAVLGLVLQWMLLKCP